VLEEGANWRANVAHAKTPRTTAMAAITERPRHPNRFILMGL
jgi:hypothetical protein